MEGKGRAYIYMCAGLAFSASLFIFGIDRDSL